MLASEQKSRVPQGAVQRPFAVVLQCRSVAVSSFVTLQFRECPTWKQFWFLAAAQLGLRECKWKLFRSEACTSQVLYSGGMSETLQQSGVSTGQHLWLHSSLCKREDVLECADFMRRQAEKRTNRTRSVTVVRSSVLRSELEYKLQQHRRLVEVSKGLALVFPFRLLISVFAYNTGDYDNKELPHSSIQAAWAATDGRACRPAHLLPLVQDVLDSLVRDYGGTSCVDTEFRLCSRCGLPFVFDVFDVKRQTPNECVRVPCKQNVFSGLSLLKERTSKLENYNSR